jgi:YVTN family beta-propeller protein
VAALRRVQYRGELSERKVVQVIGRAWLANRRVANVAAAALIAVFAAMGPVSTAAADAVTATIPLAGKPIGTALNAVTNKLYVLNRGSNTVTIIDGATNTSTTVAVGNNPAGPWLISTLNKVYMLNQDDKTVTVIDGTTNGATTFPVPVGRNFCGPFINPVANQIDLVNQADGTLTMINGATNATMTWTVGVAECNVVLNTANDRIYVPSQATSNCADPWTVIDGAAERATHVCWGTSPSQLLVNPVNNNLYLVGSDCSSPSVLVVDGVSDAVTATVTIGICPGPDAVNPVTGDLFLAGSLPGSFCESGNPGSRGYVNIIDGTTHAVTSVRAGYLPDQIVFNPALNRVYVLNEGACGFEGAGADVMVFDGATKSQIADIGTGSEDTGLLLDPVLGNLYTTDFDAGVVYVIDGATDAGASFTCANLDDCTVYAVNEAAKTVYVDNYVLDATTLGVKTTFASVPHNFYGINQTTGKVYYVNYPVMHVLDGFTNIGTALVLSQSPSWIVINETTNQIYLLNQSGNSVTVVNGNAAFLPTVTPTVTQTPTSTPTRKPSRP